jgi:beta-glucosidase
VTPLEGIRRRARGRVRVTYTSGVRPAAAARAAQRADAAVVVLSDDSSEFEDKTGISLSDGDPFCTGGAFGACGARPTPNADALVRAVAAANRLTAVVLETGGPVLLPWATRVSAILEAWYPGQEGGTALARVIWGDVDPSGRLPQSFPRRAADLAVHSPAQFPGIGGRADYSEGVFVGYRHFDRAHIRPLFSFGHGLSYTRFAFRGLRIRPRPAGRVRVSVRVTDVGRRAGVEVVQLYVGVPSRRGLPQPPRRLVGMARVALRAGRGRRLTFVLDARSLRSWDAHRRRWTVVVPGCYVADVGASSRDIRAHGAFARGRARCAPRHR